MVGLHVIYYWRPYWVGASRRSLIDRHKFVAEAPFPCGCQPERRNHMETALTIPELETPSTDAITLEDQHMEDTYYINTPCLLPLVLSLLPLPPLMNLARPSPYTQLTRICNPGPLLFPLLCRLSLPCLTSLWVWEGQTHLTRDISFWVPRVPRTTLLRHASYVRHGTGQSGRDQGTIQCSSFPRPSLPWRRSNLSGLRVGNTLYPHIG